MIASHRVFVLVSDAFGGHGGIAKFNRDLLTAVCSHPSCAEVVAVPRLMPYPPGHLPSKLTWITSGLGSKLSYIRAVLQAVLSTRPHASGLATLASETRAGFDLILCGHINLLPLAFVVRRLSAPRRSQPPIALIIHGIDAWQPTRNPLVNYLVRRVNRFVAVSELTKERFLSWTRLPQDRVSVVPNCVDLSLYGPGPKQPELLQRYGLQNKTILMTFGRLASRERCKGFDEVMEVLPVLARQLPNIAYLIAGDGPDRPRLKEKARTLGVQDRVVFAGRISDEEKADHYQLADVYVMPSRGEGFGIVLLEAMACGVPVIASKVDGSREALRNGELGELVNPANPEEIKTAILRALTLRGQAQLRMPPVGLDYFSYANFEKRCHGLLARLTRGTTWHTDEHCGTTHPTGGEVLSR